MKLRVPLALPLALWLAGCATTEPPAAPPADPDAAYDRLSMTPPATDWRAVAIAPDTLEGSQRIERLESLLGATE